MSSSDTDASFISSTSTAGADSEHAGSFISEEGPFPTDVPLLRSCEQCRRKKRKCSGHKPSCTRCKAQGESCVYRPTARYFKPMRNSVEKHHASSSASSTASATTAHYHRKRTSATTAAAAAAAATLTPKSRARDSLTASRPRAMSAIAALKNGRPENIFSLSPDELMVDDRLVMSSSQQHSPRFPTSTDFGMRGQEAYSPVDVFSAAAFAAAAAAASASSNAASPSVDGLAYMSGLASVGVIPNQSPAFTDDIAGGLTPQQTSLSLSLPAASIAAAAAATPQLLFNGQDFAFTPVSPNMLLTPSAATFAQQQQQQLYQQSFAAVTAAAAGATLYPDYNEMVLASAINSQQQQQPMAKAAALMGHASSHLYSPPLSASSFSPAGLSATPPLTESPYSGYASTLQQQQQFSMWPQVAASEPLDAIANNHMASMLVQPLMANLPVSPLNPAGTGLDFVLPQSKSEWFA
ncbi:hypothetical protein LPJ53_004936 [Coemansia erecta]|uniref:Zn(2)-C6 fungal-type domain-containing protein n=1 Tax=Coemansia erecta TaxID=147472 RepID=A0A9W8CQE0_9FUNG|nr:hypothetical protein LPJ53_004936 [Coemansia erecta]